MSFWIITVLLTLSVSAICFYPLLTKTPSKHDTKREALNKTFYFHRLQELEQEQSLGLISDAQALKVELQQALLTDIPPQAPLKQNATKLSKIWFFCAFLFLMIVSGLSYFKVGAWQAENQLEKVYQKLPLFYERLKQEESNPMNESELLEFSQALRLDLQKNPQAADKWWLLGQIAMNLNLGQLAHDSYQKAYRLDQANPEYQLSYATILMYSEDPADKAKAATLLKEILRQNQSNVPALSLLAFYYFEQEDYKMAIVAWAMMLKLLPKDDPRVELLEKSIRSARDALEEGQRK